jgi:hypothetical protein
VVSAAEWFSLGRVAFWIVMIPVAWFTGLLFSIGFLSVISLWALVESAWGAYEAAKAAREARART